MKIRYCSLPGPKTRLSISSGHMPDWEPQGDAGALGDGQTVLVKTLTPEIKDKLLIPLSHGSQGCEMKCSLGHKSAAQIVLHYINQTAFPHLHAA